MWLSVSIAGGILLALLALKLLTGAIDFLDAWTSHITPQEATRRAKLSLAGHWPEARTTWDEVRPVLIVWALIVLAWTSWSYLRH